MSLPAEGPGRRPFFKYVSAETALLILGNRTVRYSSPLTFNDPFDVQSGLHLDFDLSQLADKFIDRIRELAASPTKPPVDPDDDWGKIVLLAHHYYPTRGFPRELWEDQIRPSLDPMIQEIDSAQRGYQATWRTMLPGLRVFCVTEEWDNLLMWAHYAKDHKGAVIELWSLPEDDNALSVASSIKYCTSPPPFFTEAEWIDDLTGIKKLDTSALYYRYVYAKSDHWAYEREWRVWYPQQDSGLFIDVPVRPNELKGLYLGCNADSSFIEEAKRLMSTHFPEARVAKACKKEGAYGLELQDL